MSMDRRLDNEFGLDYLSGLGRSTYLTHHNDKLSLGVGIDQATFQGPMTWHV